MRSHIKSCHRYSYAILLNIEAQGILAVIIRDGIGINLIQITHCTGNYIHISNRLSICRKHLACNLLLSLHIEGHQQQKYNQRESEFPIHLWHILFYLTDFSLFLILILWVQKVLVPPWLVLTFHAQICTRVCPLILKRPRDL